MNTKYFTLAEQSTLTRVDRLNNNLLFFILVILLSLVFSQDTFAQPCTANVPSFTVNLTGTPDSVWFSPNVVRNGNCCSDNNCIAFLVTLDPGAEGIIFDIFSGAVPSGSMFYEVDCGGAVAVGQPLCLNGIGPHLITFCKPGNNANIYSITSIPRPFIPDLTVQFNCSGAFETTGFNSNSLTWNSIWPGSAGQYNSILSCSTACDSVEVTHNPLFPDSIVFTACGTINSACSPPNLCDTVSVVFRTQVLVSISPEDTTLCFEDSLTLITANATFGTPPYSYLWSTGATTPSITVSSGTFRVTVTDQLSCFPASDTLIVNRFTQPFFTQIQTPNIDTCAITLLLPITGSSSTGSLNWTGGAGSFSPNNSSNAVVYAPTPAELAAGQVQIIATPLNTFYCPYSQDSIIIRFFPNQIQLDDSIQSISCFGGSNGSILVQAIGTHNPFQFLWNNGTQNNSVNNLVAGSYSITVTDSMGCSITSNFILAEPADLTLSSTQVNILCQGGNNGSIDLSVNGGVGPYSYAWSNGALSEDIAGLIAGLYTVTVTDNNGCLDSLSVTLTEPADISLSSTQVNILCQGGNNGSIDLSVNGGVGPYSYAWSSGATNEDITGLTAGLYAVTVTDNNGCTDSLSITLTEPADITLISTQVNILCQAGNNGSIDLSVNGGVGPYSYAWSSGATTEDIAGLIAGLYAVTVTDNHGCTDSLSITLTEPAEIVISIDTIVTSCSSNQTGSITVDATGGIAPYSYIWSNGDDSSTINELGSGSYEITVTDQNGCNVISSFTIDAYPSLLADFELVQPLCLNGTGDAEIMIDNGVPPYQIIWSNGESGLAQSNLPSGQYSVWIEDQQGCKDTFTFEIAPQELLTVDLGPDIEIDLGNYIQLDAILTPQTDVVYNWSPQSILSCGDCPNPTINTNWSTDVFVTVVDSNGCRASDTINITVIPRYTLFIPNAFTPNGDGNNDYFEVFW